MRFLLPAKSQYACLAMLELAIRRHEDRPVAVREIAVKHNIPQPFLVQILQQLKQSGFISSTRGSQGGYRLMVDPDVITLLDICEATGCGEADPSGEAQQASTESKALDAAWSAAGKAFRDVLGNVRLDDLAHECIDSDTTMFYI